MVAHESKQVILEQLRSFEQSPSDLLAVVRKHNELNRFIQPIKYKKRLPYGAKMATLCFLKERSIPGYQIHAIMFKDTAGITWQLFCLVAQDDAGNWSVEGCSGTAGNTLVSRRFSSRPYISLSGDADGHFYAGGEVIDDTRLGIVRVHLLSNERLIGEDTVQDGLVAFVSDQSVQMPVQSEYYNQSGELVDSHRLSFLL